MSSDLSGDVEAWILDDTGAALMGFRSGDWMDGGSCVQIEHDVSATDYGLVLNRSVPPDDISDVLYRGRLGEPPTRVVDLRGPFPHGWSQEIRVDGLRTAAWMSFQAVQAVEVDGTLSTIAPAVGGGCAVADVVGDAIFVECSAPTNVFVQLPGGALTPMFASGLNYGLDSDGTDMVWVRFVPLDGGGQIQLWTAPQTTDPRAVVERHVADAPASVTGAYDLRVGFGYAALLERDDVLGVYRLSDGARAEIDAPTGQYWSGFVQYIGPEEIAATAGIIHVAPVTDDQLMFIRLDSLSFVPP